MKIMIRLASLGCLAVLNTGPVFASDTVDLTTMLQDFLAAAGDEATHAAFWAEDLVYTSSAGLRFGKAEIMAGFTQSSSTDEPTEDEPSLDYSSEEIDIRIYGNAAVVAFKLVGTPTDDSQDADVLYYFNTGTLLKRDGVWQVVAWQATKIPPQ